MAIGGFYKVENPMNTAMQGMANAAGTYASMSKRTEVKHEEAAKSVGGGLIAGAGGAASGALVGAQIGGAAGGPWGAAIGAGIGLLSYILS